MGAKQKEGAPPRYDEVFKAGAVRMVVEQGRPSVEVAKGIGICIDTLCSWMKAASGMSTGQADHQNCGTRRMWDLEAENRALKKQLGVDTKSS